MDLIDKDKVHITYNRNNTAIDVSNLVDFTCNISDILNNVIQSNNTDYITSSGYYYNISPDSIVSSYEDENENKYKSIVSELKEIFSDKVHVSYDLLDNYGATICLTVYDIKYNHLLSSEIIDQVDSKVVASCIADDFRDHIYQEIDKLFD